MPFVVCEPCRDCKHTDCVVVCPCDCFYQDEHMLYIDPEHCIDCDSCMPECPVEVIFPDRDVPAEWQHFIEINAERASAIKAIAGPVVERQTAKEGSGCPKKGQGAQQG